MSEEQNLHDEIKRDQEERKRIIAESIAALSAKGWTVSSRKDNDDRR